MDFLKENRNIIIIILVVVIGYLLLKTDFFGSLMQQTRMRWQRMDNPSKFLSIFVVIAIIYFIYSNYSKND